MIQKIIEKTNAILKGHFVLTSGKHSEYYIEKIKFINNPKYVDLLCDALSEKLKVYNCDVVVGPAYGGLVLAYEVAKKLGKRFVFTQKTENNMIIRSGFDISPKDKAIVIEDIVTTGGSVKEVINLLHEKQIEVLAIGAIVDRSGGNVDFGCDFLPLLTMTIEAWDEKDCPICNP